MTTLGTGFTGRLSHIIAFADGDDDDSGIGKRCFDLPCSRKSVGPHPDVHENPIRGKVLGVGCLGLGAVAALMNVADKIFGDRSYHSAHTLAVVEYQAVGAFHLRCKYVEVAGGMEYSGLLILHE